MDRIAVAAESILRRHPAPGLPLERLVDLLRHEGPDPYVDSARLRPLLEAQPDRFRVLDLWRGPLRSLRAAESGADVVCGEAWVAVITDPSEQEAGGARVAAVRLRESVRWLARAVDVRSTRELARWQRLLLSEAAARSRLGPAA